MPDTKHLEKTADSTGAEAQISALIAEKGGRITVADYMRLAAEHYYASQTPFGSQGDFTTAPEISQMFGEMIGAWLVDLWLQMGRPEHVQLIELGPGRGTLMADIMRTVRAWPDFSNAVSLHLVETSLQLRQAQAAALKSTRPTWYDRFEDIPEGLSFVIGNEFLDALPVHQFKKVKGQWKERCITHDDDGAFAFTTAETDFDISALMPADFLNAPDGSIYEISPDSLSVAEKIAARIEANGGAALLIDYGHTIPGLGDTLQSVYRHEYSDVLEDPGQKDVTAHVDFSLIKGVAAQRAQIHGPVPQGAFLKALGIEQRAAALSAKAGEKQKRDIATALHRLTSAGEMGILFKVIAMTPKSIALIPAGFGHEISHHGA